MATTPKKFSIRVNADEVTGLLYPAAKTRRSGITLILGHGAGGNQLSPFIRIFAAGIADRGIDAVTFNFVYSEKGRGAPDQKAKLEACYEAVIAAAQSRKELQDNLIAIGGKSMGGRIASQVVAAWSDNEKGGKPGALVFLGYPLHPPGKPEQLRDKHLKEIHAPMLFVQGTRDPFGSPDEIKAIIKRDRLRATVHEIETGDHSFKVLKSTGLTQDQVYERTMDEVARWLAATLP
jgi:hypothetical protein